ncbi:unnamed protein product [Arctia plantaginis]|uniref:Uncharacterized protein n=1 Tax=Arctia plantaginis TaxID=874455 RepID=A0A8S0ZZN4_ARCPL|nr:unnamed protein product [Arctia plantaginis]CAB3256530.1 unnamed protein product [Arctia plantaginis]
MENVYIDRSTANILQPDTKTPSKHIMKPYRRSNKVFMVEFRRATRLGRVRVLIREFAGDVRSLWKYGAPFPTFLKLIGTLILCLIVLLPLIYPFFILIITYFTYESLYLSWYRDQPWRFLPRPIARRALSAAFHPSGPQDIWKVREVLTRGILLAHSLATSVDYLCVMQGLLDET